MNMRTSILASFTVAALAAILLTGCERENDMAGKPVEFSVRSIDETSDLPQTKVTYSTISSNRQPIFWEIGDRVSIYCTQCNDIKCADYQVSKVKPTGTDSECYAQISPCSSEILEWGESENHTFYAVFPGISTTGVISTIASNVITGSIPANQGFRTISGSATSDRAINPDMKNMYMVAKNTVAANSNVDPFLDFKPMSTAVQITLKNGFRSHNSMIINSISLTSASHALSGGFKIDMNQPGVNSRQKTILDPATAPNGNTVTVSLGSSPVTVAYDKSLTVTLFMNPGNEVNDLTMTITGTNAGNNEPFVRSTELKYSNGTGITFDTHKKTVLSGLVLPERIEWEIDHQLVVTPWISGGAGINLGI